MEAKLSLFLTSELVEGGLSMSRPGRFTPGEYVPGAHSIGQRVDFRASFDTGGGV
jgi:hypothetical protein